MQQVTYFILFGSSHTLSMMIMVLDRAEEALPLGRSWEELLVIEPHRHFSPWRCNWPGLTAVWRHISENQYF